MDKLTRQFLESVNDTIDGNDQLEETDFLEYFLQLYSVYKGKNPATGEIVDDYTFYNFIIRKLNIMYDFHQNETLNRPNAFTLGALWAGTRFLDILNAYDNSDDLSES